MNVTCRPLLFLPSAVGTSVVTSTRKRVPKPECLSKSVVRCSQEQLARERRGAAERKRMRGDRA